MVVERFRDGPGPVYARFRARGRLAPPGLTYVASWVAESGDVCWQVMECDDRAALDAWMAAWADLVAFEVFPVIGTAAALAAFGTTEDERAPPVFDLQPTLRGELVALRPLRADDWDALFAVASDPLIWEQHPDRERHTEARFRVYFESGLACGGALLATDARDGRVIGSSRFHGWDPERREVEIGWTFLARSHWGGRHNAEMKALMLRHAFRAAERVVFLVGPENLRSRRAVERIGGVLAGRQRDANGVDAVRYEIARADFERRERDAPAAARG